MYVVTALALDLLFLPTGREVESPRCELPTPQTALEVWATDQVVFDLCFE